MALDTFTDEMLPAIEMELNRVVSLLDKPSTLPFYKMLTYHMGWDKKSAGLSNTGKRIRPLLVLLTCASFEKDWRDALPVAACVELIHNFSLVHDDIQDKSDYRRGRLTLWKKWGIAQAINAGDVLFILAHLGLVDIEKKFDPGTAIKTARLVNEACLSLSIGQFLDIYYEERSDLTLEDYWTMITGKTAALISICTRAGAVLGGADKINEENLQNYGHYLGLAFQLQDDYLGIWGDTTKTGKSITSDLVAGKKTFPVLYGVSKGGAFSRRWAKSPIKIDEVKLISEQLANEGAKEYSLENINRLTKLAFQYLDNAGLHNEAANALVEITNRLLNRQT
jgi:geranylgeranyl diphosphate synthase type I